MIEEAILRRVEACPACGLEHEHVLFFEHTDIFGALTHPPLVGYCPESADPISIVYDNGFHERFVVID